MFGGREQGTCSNWLTIRREDVEQRVLTSLKDGLLKQELFEEFCEDFTREMNRLRMEHRGSLTAAQRELERIEIKRKKLIEMVMAGGPAAEVRQSRQGSGGACRTRSGRNSSRADRL
jgi:hypothetical protein